MRAQHVIDQIVPPRRREAVAVVVTLLRLPLAVGLAAAVYRSSLLLTAGWLVVVVAADVADGVLARSLHADTVIRRAADVVADRATIWSAFAAALAAHPQYWSLYTPLLVRGLVIVTGQVLCLTLRGRVIQGGGLHKANYLLLAAFGLAIVSGQGQLVTAVAGMVIALTMLSGLDYGLGLLAIWRHTQRRPGFRLRQTERIILPGFVTVRLFARAACLGWNGHGI